MATDFSSLDKLMEFGLGMGIATQMMNTMNTTLARTAMPGVGINPGVVSVQPEKADTQACKPKGYYVVFDEKMAGPLTEQEIAQLVRNGKLQRKTFCWTPGLESWKFAEDIPEINKEFLLNS